MRVNGKQYRTIWVDKQNPQVIKIIDQHLLPHQFVVEELRTVADFATAIRDMHIRGAGLIGATAGFAMYCAALHDPGDVFMAEAAAILLATRPTAKNLAWAIARQQDEIRRESTPAARQKRALAVACRIADEDAEYCRRLGQHGLEIIREISASKNGPVNILTHCNAGWLAFVDYGSATAPIYAARDAGIDVHIWVDETRPWLQGSRLTAWELGQEGLPYTLIPDNTGGHLLQHGMVDMVIVGSDRTTRCGDAANKIGTYLKALAAYDNGVPFYVALPSSTFDWEICDGLREILIEQRPDDEINFVNGRTASGDLATVRISPPDAVGANYGFDVTPARLISGLITERGVCRAAEDDIMRLYPENR